MKKINRQSGYIALMSAIIISAVLTTVIFALSFSGFMARANIADTEFKKQTLNAAETCANTAIYKKIQEPAYVGSETLTINGYPCTIRTVNCTITNCIFETQVIHPVNRATTNLSLTTDPVTFAITRWQELTNF